MSMASAIVGAFVGNGAGTYVVKRGSAPTYVNGVAVPGPKTDATILAAVLPASATDLARTIEGERLRDLVVIYTGDPIFPGDDTTGAPADLLEFSGASYEIEDVDAFPGGFYQGTARKRVQS